MNKSEIIDVLNKYNFPKDEFIILSGASMVLRGLKEETHDIDIAVSKKLLDYITKNYKVSEYYEEITKTKVYTLDNMIEFSNHYYDEEFEIINNFKVQTIKSLIKLKRNLNRDKDKQDLKLIEEKINKNPLVLAYLGDSIYEFYIRKYLINQNICKVNDLQKESINYVSAISQSNYLKKILESNFLSDDEINIVKRARNQKSHKSKSADIITYKNATGLEALIGYLYQTGNHARIEEVMNFIVGD